MRRCGERIGKDCDRAAERLAHQPPQAHHTNCQKATDLAREAVGCMGVFGRWLVVPLCRPHDRTTSVWNHLAQRAFGGTTRCTRSRLA